MVIEIDLELLDEEKITPDMWIFLILHSKNMVKEAWTLSPIDNKALEYLQGLGFLKIGEGMVEPTIHVREKFLNMIQRNEDEIIGLFASTYPKSEMRSGAKVNLQKDKKRIEAKIKSLVGNDKVKANHIIACMKLDLDRRRRSQKGASWLPDLLVYLNQERWRFTEDEVNKGIAPQEDGRITNEL